MPVEVVVGDVEQHGDVGRNASVGERELERRHLGDDDVDVVADGVEQRPADVAGGDARDARPRRASPSTSVVTVVLPLVPVTATIGARRAARRRAAARSISRAHRHPGGVGGDERGVVGAHARARHHEVGGAAASRGRVGASGASTSRAPAATALGAGDPSAVASRRSPGASSSTVTSCPAARVYADDRRARRRRGRPRATAHQSSTPGMRMKSA